MCKSIFYLVAILVIPTLAFSAIIYVPTDYATIQEAIDVSVNGDMVIVKPGTYVENIDFLGKAINLHGEQGAAVTFINGNRTGSVVTCTSGEGVDTTLDGFTITNGSGSEVNPPFYGGGGMYNFQSHPTVSNCKFYKNMPEYSSSTTYGGGMYNDQSHPTVTDCTFSENRVNSGGGMYNKASHPTVTNCEFYGQGLPYNHSVYGAGMYNEESNPVVTGCRFSGSASLAFGCGMYNKSSQPTVTDCLFYKMSFCAYGAGMYNKDSQPIVTRCTFSENGCSDYPFGGDGGGIYNNGSDATITACTFIGNYVDLQGGGMFNYHSEVTVTDCLFIGNRASFGGGLADNNSASTVTNCIFSENVADHFTYNAWGGGLASYKSSSTVNNCTLTKNEAHKGGGMYGDGITIKNCILWNDTAPVDPEISGSSNVTYSDIQGGHPGTGNIDADPLFVDAADGDYHLTYLSPCMDTGTNVGVTVSTDFDGNLRIVNSTVDMGADEFSTHLYVTGDKTPEGAIQGKFVGLPGTTTVGLFVGTAVLPSPVSTMWGPFWIDLSSPWAVFYPLGTIPPNGLMVLSTTLPRSPAAPYDVPMQALIGEDLTNLYLLNVLQ